MLRLKKDHPFPPGWNKIQADELCINKLKLKVPETDQN